MLPGLKPLDNEVTSESLNRLLQLKVNALAQDVEIFELTRDGRSQGVIAVQALDPSESDLRGGLSGARQSEHGSGDVHAEMSGLDTGLLLLALLCLALDWWVVKGAEQS